MSEPTLQELRYVVAVAQQNHFGRAARACFVSQPTLSTQIKKLEDRLGVQLFERTNKQVRVTPAGEAFIAQARVVLDEAERLEEMAQGFRDPLAGTLQLGVISTLGPYLLPGLLRAVRRDFPQLRLGIREAKTATLLDELTSRHLDAFLAALPLPQPELAREPLFDEPFRFLCPEDNKLSRRKRILESDLGSERLLLLEEGHCLRDQALDVCGAHFMPRPGEDDFRAASLETIQELVAAGAGCTLVPVLALGKNQRGRPGTAVIPFHSRKASRRIAIAWRRSFPRVEVIQAISNTIRRSLPPVVHPVE